MSLKWEVDIVTPNMTSERALFRIEKEGQDLIQYDLFVSHRTAENSHVIKTEVYLNEVILFDEEGFKNVEEAKDACVNWISKQVATQRH